MSTAREVNDVHGDVMFYLPSISMYKLHCVEGEKRGDDHDHGIMGGVLEGGRNSKTNAINRYLYI